MMYYLHDYLKIIIKFRYLDERFDIKNNYFQKVINNFLLIFLLINLTQKY